MKKILLIAATAAIATLVAYLYGLTVLCICIVIIFGIELYYAKEGYSTKENMVAYAQVCAAIILIALSTGLLDGYDYYVEVQKAHTYTYRTVHQSGLGWSALPVLLVIRALINPIYIKRAVK